MNENHSQQMTLLGQAARQPQTCQPEPGLPLGEQAVAVALSELHRCSLTEAFGLMREQVEELRDPLGASTLAGLKRQLPVMEALFLRLADDAVQADRPERTATLMKAALQAQQAYARTLALVRALSLQEGQGGRVVVSLGSGNNDNSASSGRGGSGWR